MDTELSIYKIYENDLEQQLILEKIQDPAWRKILQYDVFYLIMFLVRECIFISAICVTLAFSKTYRDLSFEDRMMLEGFNTQFLLFDFIGLCFNLNVTVSHHDLIADHKVDREGIEKSYKISVLGDICTVLAVLFSLSFTQNDSVSNLFIVYFLGLLLYHISLYLLTNACVHYEPTFETKQFLLNEKREKILKRIDILEKEKETLDLQEKMLCN